MNNTAKSIVIAGIGMTTPIGLSANDTYYTARAGVSRFRETKLYDRNLEQIVTATIPHDCVSWNKFTGEFAPFAGTVERLYSLYRLACADISSTLNEDTRKQPFPLFAGVPERLFNKERIQQLYLATEGLALSDQPIRAFSDGRAASLVALHEAIISITNGQIKGAYVAGCDTYTDPKTLLELDDSQRLKSTGNLDGFVPGEGAAVLLVTTEEQAKKYNCTIYAHIIGSNKGFEKGYFGSDEPYKGEGLAACVTELFDKASPKQKISHIYSSMNGERYWSKEWGITHIRNKEKFESDYTMHHPAECFGDTGAASGVILTGLSAYAHHERHIDTDILVYTSADQGERCAVLVG